VTQRGLLGASGTDMICQPGTCRVTGQLNLDTCVFAFAVFGPATINLDTSVVRCVECYTAILGTLVFIFLLASRSKPYVDQPSAPAAYRIACANEGSCRGTAAAG
jgi:hypothetical protein